MFFDPGDAIALPRSFHAPLALREVRLRDAGWGGHAGADLVKATRRSNYVACITVNRVSAQDVGFREVFLLVDGKEVAMLRHGETVTHELPAGPHRIRAHNTLFWKTHDVVLQPGEHARFTAIIRGGWATMGFLAILGAAPLYLTFERESAG